MRYEPEVLELQVAKNLASNDLYNSVMNMGMNPYEDTHKSDVVATQIEMAYMHNFARYITAGTAVEWEPYKHLKYLSERLSLRLLDDMGGIRVIISMPPRHGKSFLMSQYMPAWYLYWHNTHKIILASYEANFAASWGRKVRDIIKDNPDKIKLRVRQDVSAINNWELTTGGGMFTAGVGGAITGKGGNLLILDDPVKNWEQAESETYREKAYEWFKSTFYSRAEPGASVIVIMTRWHEGDVVGKIIEDDKNSKWDYIKLPAIAEDPIDAIGRTKGEPLCPERYNAQDLIDIRETMGPRIFGGLYQQDPTPRAGSMFDNNYFLYYQELPDRFDSVIQSWDCSFKDTSDNDFVAGGVWGFVNDKFYLLDLVRKRMGFSATVNAIEEMKLKWPNTDNIIIETKANGPAVIQVLSEKYDNIVPIEPLGGKRARAAACSYLVEMHRVYLPDPDYKHRHTNCEWLADYLDEVGKFPNGNYDDQVDQTSQALLYLTGDQEFIAKWVASFGRGNDNE